ncbi:MAG: hypothetical protein J6X30_00540 [Clostridia bacterium]|nr:hypothetical protein [Clostridia bacterium]
MKKFLIVLVALSVVVCGLFTVSAASKQELIAKMEEVPASHNTVFHDGAVREIENASLTSAQIDKLIELLDQAKTILPKNEGARAADYTPEQRAQIFALLDQACAETGYTYEIDREHTDGFRVHVYQPNGEKAFIYDNGGILKAGENDFSYLYLVSGVLLLAAAGTVIALRKKESL